MTERSTLAEAFLQTAGWGQARRTPLAGDASNRRYERLTLGGRSAVLMDAAPERGEDVRPFRRIARHLRGLGLSAPAILAGDEAHGFLLLEDLGDDLFARVVARRPDLEDTLYAAAIDVLIALHDHPAPADLTPYDAPVMADMAALALDWYLPGATGTTTARRAEFHALIADLCRTHAPGTPVLIQRDYHAENLLWLPDRQGTARVGLLDFQDAMAGHPAYDLVSLLQDARRDVPAAVQEAMIQRYIAATGGEEGTFRTACAMLGAQRNLRILGVFARLAMRDGKAHYIDLIPRVWGYLQDDLAHPALAPLAGLLADLLPAPTAHRLQRIKAQCATIPKP